jgi:dephospho-CoA kinase
MGKSTTAAMFADLGIPVWDADATVHSLYAEGGAAVPLIYAEFPQAITGNAVDRSALRRVIAENKTALTRLEMIVHPLTNRSRQDFIAAHEAAPLVLLDIPLLYETGAEINCDAVLVVTAPPHSQRARVLARPNMTEAQFALILARQLSDAEKRSRADYVIETINLEATRDAVRNLVSDLTGDAHA